MEFRFKDREVGNVADLLSWIQADQQELQNDEFGPIIWYRGLTNKDYQLVPTLYRSSFSLADEPNLMNRFKQNAHQFLENRPQSEWEWMFLMRHHGLPSRLLDWTESPLVALYFSTENEPTAQSGAIWCLRPTGLNEIANPHMNRPDAVPMFGHEDPIPQSDEFLVNYLPSQLHRASLGAGRPPAAGISSRMNARIQAQKGVFTVHHSDPTGIAHVGQGQHVWRYIIDAKAKDSLRRELSRLRMTRLSLFPDLIPS